MNLRTPHYRLWITLGVLLACGVVYVSLLPANNLPRLRISDKLEHAAAYWVLAVWFSGLMQPRRYVWLGAGLLLLSGGVEWMQDWMGRGRQADLFDLLANGSGIVAGLLLAMAGLRHWTGWAERWLARL